MRRRDFLRTVASAGVFAHAQPGWAIAYDPTIMHVIRIRLAADISPALRARLTTTVNRFKQIHAASEFIAGRDIAGGNPFAAVASFDTVRGGDDGLAGRLNRMLAERDERFNAHDTRPASPPVVDRPRDQRWNQRRRIYHIVRLDLSSMSASQRQQRLAAMARCEAIRGVRQVFVGTSTRRDPKDPFAHAMFVCLDDEAAYQRYLAHPIHLAERDAGGRLPGAGVQWFDVVDPMDLGLGGRLRAIQARAQA
jgi:hypothetical protein